MPVVVPLIIARALNVICAEALKSDAKAGGILRTKANIAQKKHFMAISIALAGALCNSGESVMVITHTESHTMI